MSADPHELYDRIVESFPDDRPVTPPSGELVVKLPRARVAELVAAERASS